MSKKKPIPQRGLTLDGIAGILLAIFLWLLAVNPWSYWIGSAVFVIVACTFVYLWPTTFTGRKFLLTKVAACLLVSALSAAVLIPTGIDRFNTDGGMSSKEAAAWDRIIARVNAQDRLIAAAKVKAALPCPTKPLTKRDPDVEVGMDLDGSCDAKTTDVVVGGFDVGISARGAENPETKNVQILSRDAILAAKKRKVNAKTP